MHFQTESADAAFRAEADELLAAGLHDALAAYGEVHVVGSYMMRLMAWRDLDIHLVREPVDKEAFFALGGRIARRVHPRRMHYRDETVDTSPGLPVGVYWGVYFGDERNGAWKLDIWATDLAGLERVRSYCNGITDRPSDPTRETILQIKSKCWQHPEYRRGFSSEDIYIAVLDHGIRDVDEFWMFLEREGRLTMEPTGTGRSRVPCPRLIRDVSQHRPIRIGRFEWHSDSLEGSQL